MSLPAVCPGCGAEYQLPQQLSDREVHCMDCGEPFLVKGMLGGNGIRSGRPRNKRGIPGDHDELPAPPMRARRFAQPGGGFSPWLAGTVLIVVLFIFGGLALSVMWLLSGRSPAPPAPIAFQAAPAQNLPPFKKLEEAWADPQPDPALPQKQAERLPEPKAPAEPPKLNDEQLNKLLADVTLPRKVGEAVEALAVLQPDEKRAGEVVAMLAAAARSSDLNPFVRGEAARVLGRWKTPESLAALTDAVKDSSLSIRHAAIEGLATFGTEPAATAIAGRLRDPADRAHASSILKGMGAVAERAVAGVMLDIQRDPDIRIEACRILGEVGTAKSLPALEQAATADVNPLVRAAAAKARLSARAR